MYRKSSEWGSRSYNTKFTLDLPLDLSLDPTLDGVDPIKYGGIITAEEDPGQRMRDET